MDAVGRFFEFADEWLIGLGWPLSLIVVVSFMCVLSIVAFVKRTLDAGGAFSAAVLGVVVLWTTMFEGFLLFLLFFVGANVVGRVSKRLSSNQTGIRGASCANPCTTTCVEKKGSRRDCLQVLANGLMVAVAGLLWYVAGDFSALVMFGAAIAEAASDTLAGEVGRLSKKPPVSIRTFLPVPKGLSGGVTLLGTFASFVASLCISILWFLFFDVRGGAVAASIICLTGFAGSIVDSYLGACVQAVYMDPDTGILTENDSKDGRPFDLVRGVRWVDNDMVNLVSNVFSAVFALGMSALVF